VAENENGSKANASSSQQDYDALETGEESI